MKLGCRTSTAWRSGWPSSLLRQQLQEVLEVGGIEDLGGGELPDDRPELGAELRQAAGHEAADRLARLAEDAPVGDVLRALDAEDEAGRRRVAPLGEARRLLQPVIGGVDLDRAQLPAGVFELVLLRQALGIEVAAPRREDPAADADPNRAGSWLIGGARRIGRARGDGRRVARERRERHRRDRRMPGSCGSAADRAGVRSTRVRASGVTALSVRADARTAWRESRLCRQAVTGCA